MSFIFPEARNYPLHIKNEGLFQQAEIYLNENREGKMIFKSLAAFSLLGFKPHGLMDRYYLFVAKEQPIPFFTTIEGYAVRAQIENTNKN